MMDTLGEQGSRILDDANELVDLLKVAHSVAHRIQRDSHGMQFDDAQKIAYALHDVRQNADNLLKQMEEYVAKIESASGK